MTRFALRFPYLVIVCCLMVVVIGITCLARMPVDLFPPIRIPVVVVATFFSGMPPEQVENDITSRFERFFTLGSGVDHIESRSLTGVSLIKVYFQPGTDADSAVSNISNLAVANLRRLPPGTLPPVVLKFDSSSLPVCLITLKGKGLDETALRDEGQFNVRNQVANVPGASVPQPFGGRYRQIMVYVDPLKLEAHELGVMDVVDAVNESNLILPAGDVAIGPIDYNLYANGQLDTIKEINHLPLKTVGTASVVVGDIGRAADASQNQYNIVRIDGQRSVYLPVLKQGGDSNTIAVVDGIRSALHNLVDVPGSLVAKVVFDQSVFVRNAIANLIHEGVIGLVLTALMILVFLANLRATLGVFLSIPLSALAAFIVLYFAGGTINTMILGGLALVFSRLIDNSVVVLENIFRHIENGSPPRQAALHGGSEVALPVLAATLTTGAVFFPVTFLTGVSRFLFSAMAVAVVLSLAASYVVAMTVVPLFCARFLRTVHTIAIIPEVHPPPPSRPWWRRWLHGFSPAFNRHFEGMLDRYERLLAPALRWPVLTVLGSLLAVAMSMLLVPHIALAYFPRSDPGQFVINLKAPTGTRISLTDQLTARVEDVVRHEVSPADLGVIVSNIGITPDFSAMYTPNSGMHTAFVQCSLAPGHRTSSFAYIERVRARLAREVPEVSTYIQAGGMMDAVVNLGLPAPIDVQVVASDLHAAHDYALALSRAASSWPGVGDVYVPQDVDYPSLRLEIDRERAAQLGLTSRMVISNVITALTSNGMIAPSYWVDPASGNDYLLTVQYPDHQVRTLADLDAIPLRAPGASASIRLGEVCHLRHIDAPTEVDHYQLRRTTDVYIAPAHEDLRGSMERLHAFLAAHPPPKNMRVNIRGSVQGMYTSFRSFAFGLLLSVALVYLILVAQFRSFLDPLLILLAVPSGVMGVAVVLWATGTSLNIMSLMGLIMMVGIVISNSILIVEFAHRLRAEGLEAGAAVARSCRIRMRPVLMTSLATLIGLIPMSLHLGSGSEAYAPLACAVIGGLACSLVLTMFVVPCAYRLAYAGKPLRQEPDDA